MIHLRPAYAPPIQSASVLVRVGADPADDYADRPAFSPLPWYVYPVVAVGGLAGWFLAGAYAPVDRAVQFAGPVGGIAVKAAGAVGGAIVGLVGIVIVEVKTSGIH